MSLLFFLKKHKDLKVGWLEELIYISNKILFVKFHIFSQEHHAIVVLLQFHYYNIFYPIRWNKLGYVWSFPDLHQHSWNPFWTRYTDLIEIAVVSWWWGGPKKVPHFCIHCSVRKRLMHHRMLENWSYPSFNLFVGILFSSLSL